MWQLFATAFAVVAILVMVATEALRSAVHARRKSKNGLGGTQDIAMWGTFLPLACGCLDSLLAVGAARSAKFRRFRFCEYTKLLFDVPIRSPRSPTYSIRHSVSFSFPSGKAQYDISLAMLSVTNLES